MPEKLRLFFTFFNAVYAWELKPRVLHPSKSQETWKEPSGIRATLHEEIASLEVDSGRPWTEVPCMHAAASQRSTCVRALRKRTFYSPTPTYISSKLAKLTV